MNQDLEKLILAYETVSASRGSEAERAMQVFEGLIDDKLSHHPGVSRDVLRKIIIKEHRKWALKQEKKPPAIPPKT
jgi:hypothetical protein